MSDKKSKSYVWTPGGFIETEGDIPLFGSSKWDTSPDLYDSPYYFLWIVVAVICLIALFPLALTLR